ncbi:MAG: hypothetical protein JWO36_982 [Myxococcales bacterium]|nr:hypothetical protein [Myxococcales bacterium]
MAPVVRRMRSRVLTIVALGVSLLGFAASIASFVDYLGPTFCAETGCELVRASAWSHPLGVPMPVLGAGYFATMIALAFVSRPRFRIALAISGALWAVALIALQAFVIGAWCKLCMIVDPIAIVLAILVVAGAGTLRLTVRRAVSLVPVLAVALFAIGAFGRHAQPAISSTLPAVVQHAQVPGQVTVVEFVDFECPFCRAMQTKLASAIEGKPVSVVRKMVPLPQHEHALPAALAWCCAEAQGKGDAMAAALFAADPAELTPDRCEQIAARVGCDLERYRRDFPATIGRVAADMLDARGAGIRSLPTIFIGNEQLVGASYSTSEIVTLLDRAKHH